MQPIQRQTAVMLSSLLGEAVPFDFIVAASRDADAEVRAVVCVALEGLANRANPEWLIPLLDDHNSKVSHAAEEALIPFGDRAPLEPVLKALIKRGVDFEDPLAELLGTFKQRFPRNVLESLVETHPAVAAVILGELGSAAPTDLLDMLLASSNSESARPVRYEALLAAKKLKCPQLAPRLAAIMRDEQDFSRISAAGALGALGDPQYLPEILALLPLAVKTFDLMPLADGLSGYGEQMPVNDMVAFILACPPEGQEDIGDLINALEFAGAHTPLEFLVSYVQDQTKAPLARGAAAKILASYASGGHATIQETNDTLSLLIKLLQTRDDVIFRHLVAYSLGLTRSSIALEPLMVAASSPDEDGFVATGAAQGLYLLALDGIHAPIEMWRTILDHTADMRRKFAILALGSREDAPASLLLAYFPDDHLKALAHQQLLRHPPSNALDLARDHLAALSQEGEDPLSAAAHKALVYLAEVSG